MADARRRTWVLAGGLLAGVVVAAWMFGTGGDGDADRLAGDGTRQQEHVSPAASAGDAAQPAPGQPQAPVFAARAPVSCTFAPLLARGGARDGQFALQPVRAGLQLSEASAYAAVAEEALTEGRPRDAEVALIMSCRVAGLAAGTVSPQLGGAMLELAQHYANAARAATAASPMPGASTDALLERAEDLLRQSVKIYTASLGRGDSRTREAGERLAELQQATPATPPATPAQPVAQSRPAQQLAGAPSAEQAAQAQPATPPAPARPPEPTAAMGAAQESPASRQARAPEVPAVAHGASPSFDCAQARSASERLICADPQLAQLDNDLGRLRAQARSVTDDPEGLRQRDEQAWQRRESSCQDKACLLRWYQARRRQLLGEFGG